MLDLGRNTMRRAFRSALDAVLPPRCLKCGEILNVTGHGGGLCPECWRKLAWLYGLRARNPNAHLILVEHSYTRAFELLHVANPKRFRYSLPEQASKSSAAEPTKEAEAR